MSDDAPCPIIGGRFTARSLLRETVGSCRGAKELSVDAMEFDAHGQYVSPVSGIVSCTTEQIDCEISVRCATPAIASATFDGVLSPDGNLLTGTGVVTGKYRGCKKVVYEVDANR